MTPQPTPHPSGGTLGPGAGGRAVDHAVDQVLAHPPSIGVVIGAGLLAALAAVTLWSVLGHLVTMAHEGAHALAALALGGRVHTVRLNRDQTGETTTSGHLVGLPVTAAGYLGPSLFGVAGALLLARGQARAVLWLSVALLAVLFLVRMNVFGRLVVLLAGAGLLVTAARASGTVQDLVASGWVWLLLIGGVVQVLQDGSRASDFGALRRSTFVVPATIWAGLVLLVALGALAAGGAIMLGALTPPA